MSKIHLKSLFEGVIRKSGTVSVQRSNPAYSYLVCEYPHEYNKSEGTFILRREIADIQEKRSILMAFRSSIERTIGVGTEEFEYFNNEYRQNSMMRDVKGNIVLDDETIRSSKSR